MNERQEATLGCSAPLEGVTAEIVNTPHLETRLLAGGPKTLGTAGTETYLPQDGLRRVLLELLPLSSGLSSVSSGQLVRPFSKQENKRYLLDGYLVPILVPIQLAAMSLCSSGYQIEHPCGLGPQHFRPDRGSHTLPRGFIHELPRRGIFPETRFAVHGVLGNSVLENKRLAVHNFLCWRPCLYLERRVALTELLEIQGL